MRWGRGGDKQGLLGVWDVHEAGERNKQEILGCGDVHKIGYEDKQGVDGILGFWSLHPTDCLLLLLAAVLPYKRNSQGL